MSDDAHPILRQIEDAARQEGRAEAAAQIADLTRQLAEARDKALEEAAFAGGAAAVAILLRQEPDASPLKVQMTRQVIAKAIRSLRSRHDPCRSTAPWMIRKAENSR